jgi:hypothetical protein
LAHCMSKHFNYGKTPARVIAARAYLDISDNPALCPTDLMAELMLARNKPDPIPDVFAPNKEETYETQFKGGSFVSTADRDAILKHHSKHLWFCGFLVYQNTFESTHSPYETVFCYRYEARTNSPKQFWALGGPPEYNRAT